MVRPFVRTICPKCESIVIARLGSGGRPNFCAECWEQQDLAVVMITQEAWDAAQRQKELEKRIYCRNCEHIGLIEEFPFNVTLKNWGCEYSCPVCHNNFIVSLANIPMCENCDEVPAAIGDTWCLHCSD